MNRTIIVGTLHLGLTRKNDLKKLLEEIHPDQLLLELPAEQSARERASRTSDEMGFAAMWAGTKGIPVAYFDTGESVLRDGISVEGSLYKELESRQVQEIKAFSWQDLNKKEPWREGRLASAQQTFWRECIDPAKWELREENMLENIQRLKKQKGTVLILTGAGHLDFFEREFPEAEFPYRNV